MAHQVSRLGIILLGRLPTLWAVALCPFVRFTVTGIARNFHPCSLGVGRRHFRAFALAIHLGKVYHKEGRASSVASR